MNYNDFIAKRHLRAVEKFNEELKAFAAECGDEEAILYEDANTSFTLSDVKVENGILSWCYDGIEESEEVVKFDEELNEYYEEEGLDGIQDYLKFWKSCLRRAKRYWAMDCDTLDKIQDGEIEDNF